jgi:hypothetical protein
LKKNHKKVSKKFVFKKVKEKRTFFLNEWKKMGLEKRRESISDDQNKIFIRAVKKIITNIFVQKCFYFSWKKKRKEPKNETKVVFETISKKAAAACTIIYVSNSTSSIFFLPPCFLYFFTAKKAWRSETQKNFFLPFFSIVRSFNERKEKYITFQNWKQKRNQKKIIRVKLEKM